MILGGCEVVEGLVGPPGVVVLDPGAHDEAGVADGLEALHPEELLLENSDEAPAETVLLRSIRGVMYTCVKPQSLPRPGIARFKHLARLMHPRQAAQPWDAESQRQAVNVLAFLRERGLIRLTEFHHRASKKTPQIVNGASSNSMIRSFDTLAPGLIGRQFLLPYSQLAQGTKLSKTRGFLSPSAIAKRLL